MGFFFAFSAKICLKRRFYFPLGMFRERKEKKVKKEKKKERKKE